MATVTIKRTDLKVGDIAHFYGARFEIIKTKVHQDEDGDVMVAEGKWIDGAEVPCYFGKDLNWNFQGNHLAHISVEIK